MRFDRLLVLGLGWLAPAAAVSAAPCGAFADVEASSPFCASVDWLRDRTVTSGCAAGLYCPDAAVSRLAMAAFMQRLGTALSASSQLAEQALGAMPVGDATTVCATDPVAPASHTRSARVDAVLSAEGGGTFELEAVPVASLDGGQTWTPLVRDAPRTSVAPLRWAGVRAGGSIDVAPATTARFALQLRTGAPAGALGAGRCLVRVVLGARADATLSLAATVTPAGGTVEVPDRGRFVFAPGSFLASRTVDARLTASPQTQATYATTGALYLAGPRDAYEFRIATGLERPAGPVRAVLAIPPELLAAAGSTHDIEVFGQFVFVAPDGEYDQFEVIPSTLGTDGTLTVDLPAELFTDERSPLGVFEAILLIGTTEIVSPPPDPHAADRQRGADARADSPTAAGYAPALAVCKAGLLGSPLDGVLVRTSAFNGSTHKGVDYDTQDAGTTVRAAAAGTVTLTGYQIVSEPNRFGQPVRGWGWFVALRHALGQTLFAHLEPGSILVQAGDTVSAGQALATADTSGGATGSHLHFEYARSGTVYRRGSEKVDPDPCIRPFFAKLDPAGTYLFHDASIDTAKPPSQVDLAGAATLPNDFVEVEGVGAFSAGPGFGDTIASQIAVFATPSGTKLAPGAGSTVFPIATMPTCSGGLPTDVPEDFSVGPHPAGQARVPALATRLLLATNDCFLVDNHDPNNDYGVAVRIWRP